LAWPSPSGPLGWQVSSDQGSLSVIASVSSLKERGRVKRGFTGLATPTGQPINPRTDYSEWKRLLRDAGLREGRLHDARHTAATVLLVLRQPTPTVMSLMGWSSEAMAARYQHVTDALRSQVASQVGDLIWDSATGDDDSAPIMVRRNSLAAILAAIEECIASHHVGSDPSAEVLTALADLRGALPPATAAAEMTNETKTETRRPPEG
jgi:Phage integrase family